MFNKKGLYLLLCSVIFCCALAGGFGCKTTGSTQVKVYHEKPMEKSIVGSYPFQNIVYSSDTSIELIAFWEKQKTIDPEKLKWEIYNENGELVYQTSSQNTSVFDYESVSIFISISDVPGAKQKTAAYTSIELNEKTKNIFSQGKYLLELKIDGTLIGTSNFEYNEDNSEARKGPACLTVFNIKTKSSVDDVIFSEAQLDAASKTANFLLLSKVKRTFKNIENCKPSLNSDIGQGDDTIYDLKNKYPDALLIAGSLEIGSYGQKMNFLVDIYNPKKKEVKHFSCSVFNSSDRFDPELSRVFEEMFYKKGLLAYLNSL